MCFSKPSTFALGSGEAHMLSGTMHLIGNEVWTVFQNKCSNYNWHF